MSEEEYPELKRGDVIPCERCEQEFKMLHKSQRFCSYTCARIPAPGAKIKKINKRYKPFKPELTQEQKRQNYRHYKQKYYMKKRSQGLVKVCIWMHPKHKVLVRKYVDQLMEKLEEEKKELERKRNEKKGR